MNKYIAAFAAIALAMSGTSAFAQTTLGANASTNTYTNSASALQNEQNFITNNPGTVDYRGGFKTVPSAVNGAFSSSFSSDYCDGTMQGGGSWLGGAVTFGKPVLDHGCQLLRSSDMEMRIGVEWRAEANAAYNRAEQMEHEALQASSTTAVTKIPGKNETKVTITPVVNPNAAANAQLIQNTRELAYTKELKSDMIETAAAYNICKIGDDERDSLTEAGFKCPDKK
jgi:hypothetical protein